MAGVKIKLQGVSKVRQVLLAFQAQKKAQVRQVVATFGLLIESEAKRNAPVDTGRLRASIHLELRPDGLGGEVATNLTYAPIIELGGRRQRAQPFLFPAAEKYRNPYKQAVIDALRTR